ncbi:MAG TPA: VOC family protein [Chthoniobacterales bacterium]|nr:VOC family protein [Chthoniobacterales bacterium]
MNPALSFDHVHYRTSSDFKEAIHFYVDILEAENLGLVRLGATEHLQLKLGGAILLFAPSTPATPQPAPGPDRLGIFHIAFLVKDCDAATNYYVDRNGGNREIVFQEPALVPVEPPTPTSAYKVAFLKAPDGMLVELKQLVA